MKVKRVSKIWIRMSATDIDSNSKFKVTCKNADFECRNIRTDTKEKSSKFLTLHLPFCLFIRKKKDQTEWPS